MKIYLRKGEPIDVEDKLASALVNNFNNIGRPSSNDDFITVEDNGKLVFAINKRDVVYIK